MSTQTTTTSEATAAERAKGAASTATDEASSLAGTAKEQGTQVASEAAGAVKNVAQDVLSNVTDAAREQGGAQRDNIVSTLSTLGDDLSSMADQAPPGLAGDLSRQASGYARSITSRLESREPGEILDDVRRFARERPGIFLLSSLAAGVVAGRLLAGARDGIAAAEAAGPTDAPSPSTATATGQSTLANPSTTGGPSTAASLPGQPTHVADPGNRFTDAGLGGETGGAIGGPAR